CGCRVPRRKPIRCARGAPAPVPSEIGERAMSIRVSRPHSISEWPWVVLCACSLLIEQYARITVLRQNSSRDPRRGGSWWSRQAVIGSIEQEDSGGGQPACAWSAHIYKGPVENRSGLGRSIMMVQPSESLL